MLKSQSFTMRIKPEIKVALNELAARDGRTDSAWIEAVVKEKSKNAGLALSPVNREPLHVNK